MDLIVLGSRSRHGFDRLVLRKRAKSVALYADCSVEINLLPATLEPAESSLSQQNAK